MKGNILPMSSAVPSLEEPQSPQLTYTAHAAYTELDLRTTDGPKDILEPVYALMALAVARDAADHEADVDSEPLANQGKV